MIVIGSGFGDEGKGLTTSFLCSNYPLALVIRFNGGHQAGHTVVHNGKRHVFSSFGSGTLQNIPTYWSEYCTFNPHGFLNERAKLIELGIVPKIYINPNCPITTPLDVILNGQLCQTNSCGVGFGTTIQRHENNYKLFVRDLLYPTVFQKKFNLIKNYYQNHSISITPDIEDRFFNECKLVLEYIIISDISEIQKHYYPYIFEGAQGILLDQDFGFFPDVTRSYTTSRNAIEIINKMNSTCPTSGNIEYIPEIYYVTRTYLTRHGRGYFPETDNIDLVNNINETNRFNPYQGEFRKTKLNLELLKYAFDCDNTYSNQLKKNLIITCNDQYKMDQTILNSLRKTINFEHIYVSNSATAENIVRIF